MAKKITNPALSAMREAAEVEPARARVRCRSELMGWMPPSSGVV